MSGFSKSGHEHKSTSKYTTEHFKISIEMDTLKMSSSFVEFMSGESGWNDKSILKMGTYAAYYVACENIRFSNLFAAGDLSHGGTSATQRQKFHTDLEPHDYRIY